MTGGTVEMIDLSSKKNVYNEINLKSIATKVLLKVKLHKGLEFRNEDKSLIDQTTNILMKRLGNVNADSEVTFEYRLKSINKLLRMEEIDFS